MIPAADTRMLRDMREVPFRLELFLAWSLESSIELLALNCDAMLSALREAEVAGAVGEQWQETTILLSVFQSPV